MLNPHILEFCKIKNFKIFVASSQRAAPGAIFAGAVRGGGVWWGSGRIDHSPTIASLWITILV